MAKKAVINDLFSSAVQRAVGLLASHRQIPSALVARLSSAEDRLNVAQHCRRNIDDAAVYPDTVYIIRDRSCFNALGNGPASAPLLAPGASLYLNRSGVAPGLAVSAPSVAVASLG